MGENVFPSETTSCVVWVENTLKSSTLDLSQHLFSNLEKVGFVLRKKVPNDVSVSNTESRAKIKNNNQGRADFSDCLRQPATKIKDEMHLLNVL
jgi:hypothetical protein